jgi:hypothetical protein
MINPPRISHKIFPNMRICSASLLVRITVAYQTPAGTLDIAFPEGIKLLFFNRLYTFL